MVIESRSNDASGAQSIQRCAVLLRLITAHNRTGLRLVDLYRSAGLSRPTTHRILQALVAERLIRQDQNTKHYFLGSAVYEMGLAAAPPAALRDICQPFLQTVAEQTGDTVFLTVRSGLDGVCMARAEGAFPIKAFVLEVGRRRPLNIGGGARSIMSSLPDEEIIRICKVNQERTLRHYPRFSMDVLWRQIRSTRHTGYLINDILEVEGIRSLAVSILNAQSQPVGALSVSALESRIAGDRIHVVASYVRDAVTSIEERLSEVETGSQKG